MRHPIRGQRSLLNTFRLGILLQLLKVCIAHRVEIQILGVNDPSLIRRSVCPTIGCRQIALLDCFERLCGVVVREGVLAMRPLQREGEGAVVLLQVHPLQGQLLSGEGLFGQLAEACGQVVSVKQLLLSAGVRIHHIPTSAVARLVVIPEFRAVVEIMGCHRVRKQPLLGVGRSKSAGLRVFRQDLLRLQGRSDGQPTQTERIA